MLGTTCGDLKVGAVAWLDAGSGRGRGSARLAASDAPEKTGGAVKIDARTRRGRHRPPPCPGPDGRSRQLATPQPLQPSNERHHVSGGATVFLTTQYLDEADELADHIAVLNDGRIVAEGSAEELKRLVPGGHVRLRFTDPAAYRSAAVALREATQDDESLSLQIPSGGSQRELRAILDWLDAAGIETDELTVHTPDLDDVFFALTDGTKIPNHADQPKENVR